jgi:hypothetical protein
VHIYIHRDTKQPQGLKNLCTTLPAVTVVMRGGAHAGTFQAMSDCVDTGIPLVVIKGSGGAADFIADLWEQLHSKDVKDASHRKLPAWVEAKNTVRDALKEVSMFVYVCVCVCECSHGARHVTIMVFVRVYVCVCACVYVLRQCLVPGNDTLKSLLEKGVCPAP